MRYGCFDLYSKIALTVLEYKLEWIADLYEILE